MFFVVPVPWLLTFSFAQESKIKGYIHIVGYKVTVDENIDPGRYGFRIDHDNDNTHYFSSDEKSIIRDWMKAIIKATIGRDYTSTYPPIQKSTWLLFAYWIFEPTRTRRIFVQHPDHPFGRRTSNEPCSSPSVPDRT